MTLAKRSASSHRRSSASERRVLAQTQSALASCPGPPADAEPPAAPFDAWLRRFTPNYNWDWKHLQVVQTQLQEITKGELDRLMLFMPPRHGKSECATVRYPVYRLFRKPDTRVIVAAYNQTLANRFSRKMRSLMRSHGELKPLLSRDRAAAEEWETTAGGGVRAVGVGGGVTGMGADLIVIDDPVKSREQAESQAFRERSWEWYTDDVYTRLEPNGGIILILTRWHEDDLAGRILTSDDAASWRVVRMPALAETPEERDFWARRYRRTEGFRIRSCAVRESRCARSGTTCRRWSASAR